MNFIIQEDIQRILQTQLAWERLKNTTVLITGANGFLPAYMVETIMYLNIYKTYNIKLICLVRNLEKAHKRFQHLIDHPNFNIIEQDVCQIIEYEGDIDYIIHAASQASPNFYATDPVGTSKPNIIGTYNLLELARKKETKSFLFFSSGEVYGEVIASQLPAIETTFGYLDCNTVRACYAESKRMGETLCQCYWKQYGINTKIVRPTHTYGPGMNLNDTRVFADFVNCIIQNKNIELRSNGHSCRTFCYLGDATVAYFMILLSRNGGEAYNVGNPQCEISILELAKKLIHLYPDKKLKVEFKANDVSEYLMSATQKSSIDISKIQRLGWKPCTSIEAGFKRTIDSFLH
jgi:UDP-glucuronate decarboxylase